MSARPLLFGGLKALEGTELGSDTCKYGSSMMIVFNH